MDQQRPVPTRRDVLKGAGLLTAALALGGPSSVLAAARRLAAPPAGGPGRSRVLRVAHLTDFHVQPERHGAEGMAACLRHVAALNDRPDLILTGGDLVMDVFEQPFDRSKMLWDLFTGTLRDGAPCPVEHCLGNHDIWGWNKAKSGTNGTEATWGKAWAMQTLGLARPYRSFDKAGWHFVILDSVQSDGGTGYVARLDEAQMDWLQRDLAAVPATTPVLVLSHVPILAACMLFDSRNREVDEGKWTVPGGNMHLDARALRDLFRKHPNVKLCLSGHIHQCDRVDYSGVTYICDGAVSGAWWKGKHQGFGEGYGVVDLYDDGTFGHEFIGYGWEARE
ncbi:MAG: metallophosphoesterase [Phycisphaeraceae bacterium]|nr:metallophosphoesterase [Phycisphaeraceae bacterium]